MSAEIRDDWVEDEINLLDYWRVLVKYKVMILGVTFAVAFLTGTYCYFIATKIYESTASILAPKESSGGGLGLAAALANSAAGQFLGGLIPTGGTNRDTFVAILKSRTMAAELVDRFKLEDYYQTEFKEQAIRTLQGATEIEVSKEGVIAITVADKDPKLAADIANAYVRHLDRMFVQMGAAEGGSQRAFIAAQLAKTEGSLRQAEDALRRFQEQNKAVVLPEQSKGAIDAAAKVRGEIAAAEVQLEAMRAYATEDNPNVIQQRKLIQELKRQLAQMQYGQLDLPPESAKRSGGRQEFHVPFDRVAELGMELIRLTREVKVQEAVFTLLTQQLEQAKIQEAKDTPTVQPLDRAVPAELKSWPKTVLTSGVAGAFSLFLTTFLAFFLEYLDRLKKEAKAAA